MRTQFLAFRDSAQKLTSSNLILYHQKTKNTPRLAVVVPKKAAHLATFRNRLKRLAKPLLLQASKDLSQDLVLLFKPTLLAKNQTQEKKIKNELNQLLAKIN